MKRYTPHNKNTAGPVEFLDDPNGYWVPYREVEEIVRSSRRKLLLDLWGALPGHEKTGDCAGSLRATLLFSEVGDEIRRNLRMKDVKTPG